MVKFLVRVKHLDITRAQVSFEMGPGQLNPPIAGEQTRQEQDGDIAGCQRRAREARKETMEMCQPGGRGRLRVDAFNTVPNLLLEARGQRRSHLPLMEHSVQGFVTRI